MPRLQGRCPAPPSSNPRALTAFHVPAPTASRGSLLADTALLVACVVTAGAVSLLLGQDANWDLQNYHFYNPWAWWNGRIFDRDIAAAQLQTYHNPLLDMPFYAMVAADWPPRAIAFALAVPAGIAAFFLAKLLPLLFADLPRTERRVAVVASFAIGVTSAMGIATLGTTMNEWPLVALTMPALWLVVRALVNSPAQPLQWTTLVGAGLLCGLASGVKLTAAMFAVALCMALLLRGPHTGLALRRNFRESVVFGLAVLAALALSYGPWGYQLWVHYASPIFPYGNEWIDSPWWVKYQVIGRRYGPHTLAAWLQFPFDLLNPKPFYVVEVPYRDARMPILYAFALFGAAVWISIRMKGRDALPRPAHAGVSRAWRFLSIFFIISFLLWTAQHSVYRYLIALDLLSGALIVTLIFRNLKDGHASAVVVVLAVLLVATTRYATWGRVGFGDRWFDVKVPELESNAMVVLATDAPMAYVLPLIVPPTARNVGIDNGFINARRKTRMEDEIAQVIRVHDGPIYSLADRPGRGADALLVRGLLKVTETCVPVSTNIVAAPLELCRVVRKPVND
jgi:hypothetical protein